MVPEAMRGGNILRQEFGYETRVINTHTVKPIDVEAIVCAAKETEMVIAAEEHQIGALAWRVSGLLAECPELYGVAVITGAIWRERPFRRFRRALGVDQRVRGQRRTHRAESGGVDHHHEGEEARREGGDGEVKKRPAASNSLVFRRGGQTAHPLLFHLVRRLRALLVRRARCLEYPAAERTASRAGVRKSETARTGAVLRFLPERYRLLDERGRGHRLLRSR